MNTTKLFHVLVVGGALMTGSAFGGTRCAQAGAQLPAQKLDELLAAAEPKSVFCTDDEYCEMGPDGKKHVKQGFECCWGTSCESLHH